MFAHPIGKVTLPPPPANDEPDGAVALTLGDAAYMQDTSTATSGVTDPVCPEIQPFASHTVWFTITAGGTDTGIELSTVGSDFDTTIQVLDAGGAVVACNDDIEGGVVRQSDLVFAVTAGTTYTVVVGSWEATNGGNLVLTATPAAAPPPPPPPDPAPANDSPSGAFALTLRVPAAQDTTGATADPAEDPADGFCDYPSNGATVWYTLAVADAGWIEVNTFNSDYDTTLYVFDADGILLACNDQANFTNQSQLKFFAEAGGTYSVLVGSWAGAPGGSLVLSAQPTSPPLTVEVTVDAIGQVDTRSGTATLSGTVTCSELASGGLFVSLTQEGGRFLANSGVEVPIESCEGTTEWAVVIPRGTAKFQAGEAFVRIEVFFDSEDDVVQTFTGAEVTLRPQGSLR